MLQFQLKSILTIYKYFELHIRVFQMLRVQETYQNKISNISFEWKQTASTKTYWGSPHKCKEVRILYEVNS